MTIRNNQTRRKSFKTCQPIDFTTPQKKNQSTLTYRFIMSSLFVIFFNINPENKMCREGEIEK